MMNLEIERKFLLNPWTEEQVVEFANLYSRSLESFSKRSKPCSKRRPKKPILNPKLFGPSTYIESVKFIDQGWIPGEVIKERIRSSVDLRTLITKYYRTVKFGSGLVRTEYEEEIDSSLYRKMLPLLTRKVSKTRYNIITPNYANDKKPIKIEMDIFRSFNKQEYGESLHMIELELLTHRQRFKFSPELQARIVREVTDDPKYVNSNIAVAYKYEDVFPSAGSEIVVTSLRK